MSPRATVAAGLLAGAATALLLILVAVALLPDPSLRARSSTPTRPAPSAGASAVGSDGIPGASAVGSPAASTTGLAASGARVGQRAPALRVPQVGGGSVDLAALKGRPVWIDFTQMTCERCRDELVAMNDFAARYADAGLVVVAIDVREAEPTVAGFAQALGLTFPVGLDADGSAAGGLGVSAFSSHVWIDRDGVIRAQATGPLTRQTMAADLATILPTVLVTPS